MYYKHKCNKEAPSLNYGCRGKAALQILSARLLP